MVDENVALKFALKYVVRKPAQAIGGAIAGFACGLVIVGINEQTYKKPGDSTSGILQPNETTGFMFGLPMLGLIAGLYM